MYSLDESEKIVLSIADEFKQKNPYDKVKQRECTTLAQQIILLASFVIFFATWMLNWPLLDMIMSAVIFYGIYISIIISATGYNNNALKPLLLGGGIKDWQHTLGLLGYGYVIAVPILAISRLYPSLLWVTFIFLGPLVEEVMKATGKWFFLQELDETPVIEGKRLPAALWAGALVGIGFGIVEGMIYVARTQSLAILIKRIIIQVPLHGIYSGLVFYGIHLGGRKGVLLGTTGILLHMAWNGFIYLMG